MVPLCDLHMHTIASGHAFSTIDEMARAAAEKNLQMIAVTDHGPALPGGAHPYYFWNLIKSIPETLYGVRILKGAEANIVDNEGALDLPDDILGDLDLVIASLHFDCGYEIADERQHTDTLLKVLDNKYVNILGHPGNPYFPFHHREVLQKAKEKNILVELNNSSFKTREGCYENCLAIAKMLKELDMDVILGSDAHFKDDVGKFTNVLELASTAGIDKNKILNYFPDKLLKLMNTKK